MNVNVTLPIPVRASLTDDPAEILAFAADTMESGEHVALATLIEVRGGAARALGSHVAVASDGRFCGYVSGGCVEAAVASEALHAMAAREDRTVKFGTDSPFFDIVLPCGGGITVAIHLLRDAFPIRQVLLFLKMRQAGGLRYSPDQQALEYFRPRGPSRWMERDFVTVYPPSPRVLISGDSIEARAVASIGKAAGYEVFQRGRDLKGVVPAVDAFTAVVLLHHDLDAEEPVLNEALNSPAFYIGALGSARTHAKRTERLRATGWSIEQIDRIKAPIGLFGPTRDSNSLALSVMADVAASRLSMLKKASGIAWLSS
ncbi:XdhC family protein [Sinorhizobium sp. 8-89]|uniref:XdhC family protein n=1 Tax=Sinorhizobium sp. 7-81 TaxID=3049087 RepID=UPI0024C410E6|nr:XdhC family protein [Sinorhizobium sp. 7-81]MDK1386462.1 XdhC family protein [Sinorhizobium sp. 7-81]